MGKLRSLIDFLPYYYKDADTYKVDGKGILERFLEICGTYLEDSISKDIEYTLDNIDIDKTPEYFLTYLWEMLGELPFAYPALVDPEKFEQYYKGLDSTMEMEAKKKLWELVNTSPLGMSKENNRNVLKYAITLMKIRGTKKFFETVFKLYGLKCEITDPVESTYKDPFSGVTTDYLIDNDTPKFDHLTTMDSGDRFDKSMGKCTQCLTVDIKLEDYGDRQFMGSEGTGVAGSNSILLFGKPTAFVDIVAGANDYNSRNFTSDNYKAFRAFRMVIEKYFDKYLPFNVSIGKLSIGSVELVDEYSIELYNLPLEISPEPDINSEGYTGKYTDVDGNIVEVPYGPHSIDIGVKVTCTWEFADCSYLVARDTYSHEMDSNGINISTDWMVNTIYTDPFYKVYVPGTYIFLVNKDHTKITRYDHVWYLEDKYEGSLVELGEPKLTTFRKYYRPNGEHTEYEHDVFDNNPTIDWYISNIVLKVNIIHHMYRGLCGVLPDIIDNPTEYPFKLIYSRSSMAIPVESTKVLVEWPRFNEIKEYIILSNNNLWPLPINQGINNQDDIRYGKVKITLADLPNVFREYYIPKLNRVFTIRSYDRVGSSLMNVFIVGDAIRLEITSDDPLLDELEEFDLKAVQVGIQSQEEPMIISNHGLFVPKKEGEYTFVCNMDMNETPKTFTITVNKLPLEYDLDVTEQPLQIHYDLNTNTIIPVKVKVLCKEVHGKNADFRVKCKETGEIKVCNIGRYFTFTKQGTYHLYCMADESVTKVITINKN